MSYVLIVLLLMVATTYFIFIKGNDSSSKINEWDKILSTAALISSQSEKVAGAIEFAKSDRDILNENSTFYVTARNQFGDRYVEWIDEDLAAEKIPAAVFKTVLHGYGFMAYLDWKDIYDPDEVFCTLSNVFTVLGLKEVNNKDIALIKDQVEQVGDSSVKAVMIIKAMEKLVHSAGHEIAWFDESGDSFAFFILQPETAQKLENVVLDEDHRFISTPVFK